MKKKYIFNATLDERFKANALLRSSITEILLQAKKCQCDPDKIEPGTMKRYWACREEGFALIKDMINFKPEVE